MARPQKNTERVNVFFAPETLEKLKKEADGKGTNVSGLIRMIVLEYFQKK